MPIPAPKTAWPPPEYAALLPDLDSWEAWWAGDPAGLQRAYGGSRGNAVTAGHPAQRAGGLVGAAARLWWGRPTQADDSRQPLHMPLAADLCQVSSDLLYADPLDVECDTTAARDALDSLLGDQAYSALAEAAELSAAAGTAYLRVAWDEQTGPDPFLTALPATSVIPVFRWGRLVEATVHTTVADDPGRVLRHLEHHMLDGAGIGVVEHALYEGTGDNLGVRVPLADHPATAGLAVVVAADSLVTSGTPGLLIQPLLNLRPQRRWRRLPLGSSMGRSDLDGLEGMLDALDETWSSWMRDLRLGKARLIVPDTMLDVGPAGSGAAFDTDREIFTTVAAVGTAALEGDITQVQFAIRVDEHERTVNALVSSIVRAAGYSASTLGMGEAAGGAMTATEVVDRNRRSLLTRDRKIRLHRPSVEAILTKLGRMRAELNGGPAPQSVTVTWPEGVQVDPEAIARTAGLLRTAQAASTDTLVRMAHPDWTDDQVAAEVAAVREEASLPAVADPLAAGEDDAALTDQGITFDQGART